MVNLRVGLRCKCNFALVLELTHDFHELLILDLLHTFQNELRKSREPRLEARSSLQYLLISHISLFTSEFREGVLAHHTSQWSHSHVSQLSLSEHTFIAEDL